MLVRGHVFEPFTASGSIYPPLTFLVGSLATLIGGVSVAVPVLAQNLVYVPLLALGCYQTAKLGAGPRAGALAVVFALGTPLLIEQFHVFMLDAPEAAFVAVSVWLILASDRFSRLGFTTAAGVAVGLGLESKQQFPTFVAGLVVVVILRNRGWRNWRGIVMFVLVALAVGSPWYALHLSELSSFNHAAVATALPGTRPDRISIANLGWYLWALLNTLLFAPLFVLFAIGSARTAAKAIPPRPRETGVELLAGLVGAWLILLATPIHVTRYLIPLSVYIAVLGTTWIARMQPVGRSVTTAALTVAVVATTLGATLGVGPFLRVSLQAHRAPDWSEIGVARSAEIVFYSNHDFIVSGPRRGGDVLRLLRALRRTGIARITFLMGAEDPKVFAIGGLLVFARIAGLTVPPFDGEPPIEADDLPAHAAVLMHELTLGNAPPCVRLSDGTGIWVRLGRALAPSARDFCPFWRPATYGP